MNHYVKQTFALAFGAILLSGLLSQAVQAGVIESGTAVLGDANGATTGPEALVVDYSVSLTSGLYTYSYDVYNPCGDVVLSSGLPEEFSVFAIEFNTTLPGAVVGNALGGGYDPITASGISWNPVSAIYAGNSSGPLTFESYLPPEPGDAGAQDSNPPSPWSTITADDWVPVPGVPDSTSTMALLLPGCLLLLPFRSILEKNAGLSQ